MTEKHFLNATDKDFLKETEHDFLNATDKDFKGYGRLNPDGTITPMGLQPGQVRTGLEKMFDRLDKEKLLNDTPAEDFNNKPIYNVSDGSYVLVDREGGWTAHVSEPTVNELGQYESVITTNHGITSKDNDSFRIEQHFKVAWAPDAIDQAGGLKADAFNGLNALNDSVSERYEPYFGHYSSKVIEESHAKVGPLAARDAVVVKGMESAMKETITDVAALRTPENNSQSQITPSFSDKSANMEGLKPTPGAVPDLKF